MAQKVYPIVLIEKIGSTNPGHSTKRAQELLNIGWVRVSQFLHQEDGTTVRLVTTVHPEPLMSDTASEPH